MVSTIPRSGTWRTIYFFHVYRELLNGTARPDVVKLHPQATNRADNEYLKGFGIAPLIIDHYPCFGFNRLKTQAARDWTELTTALGNNRFFRDLFKRNRYLSPQRTPQTRICFILRNPLEVCISTAKLQPTVRPPQPKQRLLDTILGRKTPGYKFNPQWPIASGETKPHLSLFDEVISNFRVSRMMEAYIAYMMTFVHMQQAFPANVIIVPYEETLADPECSYLKIVTHLGLAEVAEGRCKDYVRQAVELTSYDRMKEYEIRLGQSISTPPLVGGKKKIPWQTTLTHLPVVKHEPWQALFGKEDFRYVLAQLEQHDLTPEQIGPLFAKELRALAI